MTTQGSQSTASPAQRLVLFDVDATLISTSRSGIRAMRAVTQRLFGPGVDIDRVEFAGKLDPLIIADILRLAGRHPTPASISEFAQHYRNELNQTLNDPATSATALPGVVELINTLAQQPGLTLGLLTGNFEATGTIKLHRCGLRTERFGVRAWAEDATGSPPSRDELPGVAMTRWGRLVGPDRAVAGRAVVIGDTPHDIRCAKVNQMASIAVATGPYEVDQLAAYAPSVAVEDLSDVRAIVGHVLALTAR
jgi:phosphoglycolate phosphatase-like HAD superfamily hydrolase